MAGGGGSDPNKAKAEPNVVPLCDILLVLLIIFMVVTPMIQKGANVELPQAKNNIDQPEPGQLITVHIKRNGAVYLDEDRYADPEIDGKANYDTALSKLAEQLDVIMEEKKMTERKILVRADKDVVYGTVADVLDEIRNASIEMVGLITEQAAAGTN